MLRVAWVTNWWMAVRGPGRSVHVDALHMASPAATSAGDLCFGTKRVNAPAIRDHWSSGRMSAS